MNGHAQPSSPTWAREELPPPAAAGPDMAQERARQVLAAAERDARQLVQGAERYADDVLANLEAEIARALQTVQNGRQYLRTRRHPGQQGG